MLELLPLAAYAVPVALARGFDWLLSSRRHLPPLATNSPGVAGAANQNWLSFRSLWLWATCGPWITAWALTAGGIAPVFHRRFVIVSAVPLILLAAGEVGRRAADVRGRRTRRQAPLGARRLAG